MLLWPRTGRTEPEKWSLPGSFLRERERLAEGVARTLREKCGVAGLAPRQLGVMDDPRRDDRGWVLSVAHLAVVRPEALAGRRTDADVRLALVHSPPTGAAGSKPRRSSVLVLPDGQRHLPFDHETIAALAIDDIRARYRHGPDPAGLIAEPFTMRQLRLVHEAVQGQPLQKDTFRRAMIPFLERLDGTDVGTVGRPARLYRHARPRRGRRR
jgi:8-oxo-dGTP diphosphatase